MIPNDVQTVLQSILPSIVNPTNLGSTNETQTQPISNPNNNIIMLYEDLGSSQSGLSLTDIHEVSRLMLNEKTDENEEQKICSICQQPIEWDTIIRKMNTCDHEYHVTCIDQWLVENTTCPTCRRELNPNGNANSPRQAPEPTVSSYQFRVPVRNSS
jgi:hypothetical protein